MKISDHTIPVFTGNVCFKSSEEKRIVCIVGKDGLKLEDSSTARVQNEAEMLFQKLLDQAWRFPMPPPVRRL